MISPDDVELLSVTDDPEEAVDRVLSHYRQRQAARRRRRTRKTRSRPSGYSCAAGSTSWKRAPDGLASS